MVKFTSPTPPVAGPLEHLPAKGQFEQVAGGPAGTTATVTFARRGNTAHASFLAAFSIGKDREPPALRLLPAERGKFTFEVKKATKDYTFTIDPKSSSVTVKAD